MRYSYLRGVPLALILSASAGLLCAGLLPANPAVADAATGSQQGAEHRDPALAAFEENLPKGATIGSVSVRQLNAAVRRTLYAHPEMSGELAAALIKAAPGRKKMIQKAVSSARAAYMRQAGRGAKPAAGAGVDASRR